MGDQLTTISTSFSGASPAETYTRESQTLSNQLLFCIKHSQRLEGILQAVVRSEASWKKGAERGPGAGQDSTYGDQRNHASQAEEHGRTNTTMYSF